jgi:hypothetical protein
MKKFKSLMLAALASAALAAPSFADGHSLKSSGEVVLGMKYSSATPDGGDTTTVQDTYIGDINMKLSQDIWGIEFNKDDEGKGKVHVNWEATASSGDNSVTGSAKIEDIVSEAPAYGDVFIKGANKTLSVKVGKFGSSENYSGGMGNFRASDFGVGNVEHIVIDGFMGLQADVDAGDIDIELSVPWMETASGAYALKLKDGTETKTNVTGIRPVIKGGFGDVSVTATFYTLSFSAQNNGVGDTQDKSDSAFQLMGKVGAGAATVGFGYTTKTTKNGEEEMTPSTLNGFVEVGLSGGSKVGASFEVLGSGHEKDEATATRISASYNTPFFVEAVTLKLGAGTSTVSSDDKSRAGSASGFEAEWAYSF